MFVSSLRPRFYCFLLILLEDVSVYLAFDCSLEQTWSGAGTDKMAPIVLCCKDGWVRPIKNFCMIDTRSRSESIYTTT